MDIKNKRIRERKSEIKGGDGASKKVPSLSQAKPRIIYRYIQKKLGGKVVIKQACQYVKVSRSGYSTFLNRGPSNLAWEKVLSEIIRAIFFQHKTRYGSRRIQVELTRMRQISISRKRIGRLLRTQGLYTKGKRHKYQKQVPLRETNPNLVQQHLRDSFVIDSLEAAILQDHYPYGSRCPVYKPSLL
ncbi:transposase [Listeria booriae]|uniref:Transposase n=1 Tax=Listeria booriae TaxID=1552123 RepID=A0A841Y9R4_9LIST|nr:IS3 family transposase [Listeria booriae]MBC1373654.1 transposase [Listeria booriae]